MKKIFGLIFVASILLGCATTSGVVSIDKGVYYIQMRSPQLSFGPPVRQKAYVYKKANDYCQKQNKNLKTIKIEETNQVFGQHGNAALTFSCE